MKDNERNICRRLVAWSEEPQGMHWKDTTVALLRIIEDAKAALLVPIHSQPKSVLLDVCRRILEEMESRYDGAPDSETLWMAYYMNELREAIAKATA